MCKSLITSLNYNIIAFSSAYFTWEKQTTCHCVLSTVQAKYYIFVVEENFLSYLQHNANQEIEAPILPTRITVAFFLLSSELLASKQTEQISLKAGSQALIILNIYVSNRPDLNSRS